LAKLLDAITRLSSQMAMHVAKGAKDAIALASLEGSKLILKIEQAIRNKQQEILSATGYMFYIVVYAEVLIDLKLSVSC
jgi:hypothetical protein